MVLHCRLLAVAAVALILLSAAPEGSGQRHRSPRLLLASRRQLFGPGSSPPTCRFRCGTCRPCTPVHVAIQPGLFTPMDYYPEAWRCSCAHRLYMP